MKKYAKPYLTYLLVLAMLAVPAMAALTPITDYAVRSPSGSDQVLVSHVAVPGGTLYTVVNTKGGTITSGTSTAFVPVAAAQPQRYLGLTDVKSVSGVPVTTTAGSGVPAIVRTAGKLYIAGEAASGVASTDAGVFELSLPDSYVAGADLPVTINASVAGTGTLVAASTTITLAAYTEVNGVETALTVTAAQQIVAAGSDLTFTVTGTGLTPASHILLEITMVVTSTAGNFVGHINSVAIKG